MNREEDEYVFGRKKREGKAVWWLNGLLAIAVALLVIYVAAGGEIAPLDLDHVSASLDRLRATVSP